ncbi:MAG: esterase-like activity of phytase family protein [Pseudomonadota bacterium]
MRRAALSLCLVALLATCDETETAAPPPLPDGVDFVVRAPKIDLAAARRDLGPLEWRGGVSMQWRDPSMGGYSGLHISSDGARLTAIGRNGWLQGRLAYDANGALTTIEDIARAPLLGPDGRPLADDDDKDAEALAADGSGFIVGYETRNRIARHADPSAAAEPVAIPEAVLTGVPDWGGFSALATLPDGRLIALTEGARDAEGVRGWIEGAGPFWLRSDGDWLPVGMTCLPEACFILEIAQTETGRFDHARISSTATGGVAASAIIETVPFGELRPPAYWEKIEAIAVRRGANGDALLYLMSDSRGSWPTDVLMFALPR